jgi:fumarate reductase iron-sulfur subunit
MTVGGEGAALGVEIWRGTDRGRFQSFAVADRTHQTVIDVVTEVQREQDATLSYRFACRVGMCGSCAWW